MIAKLEWTQSNAQQNKEQFCNYLDGEERAGCFTLFVFLVSRDCCVALPHDATGLSAVCDCGIS